MSKKESRFEKKRITLYEKKNAEIDEFFLEYKKHYLEYKSKISSSARSYENFTTDDLFSITPDFIIAGGDINNKTISYVKEFYRLSSYIDEYFPDYRSLSLEEKMDKLIDRINNGESLNNGIVANMLYLSAFISEKYKTVFVNLVKPKITEEDIKQGFPKSVLAGIKKSNLKINSKDAVEMLKIIKDYKKILSTRVKTEFIECEKEKDDEILMHLSKGLKQQYIKTLKNSVISSTKSAYYRKTNDMDKEMDFYFPELSYLRYDKKIEELLERVNSDDPQFDDKSLVGLLYLSSQVSADYKNIYGRIAFVDKSDTDAVISKLRSFGITLDPKDMIERLKKFNDFYISGLSALEEEQEFINELQKINFIDEEKLNSDIDQILDAFLPSAYGLVKLACNVKLGINPYEVQLMGANVLNNGEIAEMYTGEGKSLTALFPAYLNALTGREVDIYTPNDYLATRDSENAKRIMEPLGISVGCVLADNQSLDEKRSAFTKSIVYGTGASFAFSTIEHSYDPILRDEKPFYAIIDEADQFFVDEALVPYKLDSDNGNLAENRQIRQYLSTAYDLATHLCERPFSETDNVTDDQLKKYSGLDLTKKFGLKYGTKEEKNELDYVHDNFYVVLGETDILITDLGNVEMFRYLNQDKVAELVEKSKSYFLNDHNYIEGDDYLRTENTIELTDKGLLKAIQKVPAFADLESEWLSKEETQVLIGYVKTQLRAFSMTKGANDNGYDVRVNPETGKEEIVILQAGRVKEMSKYERGLHQALQLKEGLEIDDDEDLMDSSFDSITIVTLLNRYHKVAGMTGTADKDAFREIYNKETIGIPKNAEYQYDKKLSSKEPAEIEEHPTIFYKENSYKLGAIVADILHTRSLGQPVLMITDNNEEAELIYKKLKSLGIETGLNLLTSNKNLEEEAQIISRAGKIGAITIASEMAGRGTDIKLYSDSDKQDAMALAKEEVFKEIALTGLYIKKNGIKKLDSDTKTVELKKFERSIINTDMYRQALSDINHSYETDPEFKKNVGIQIDALATIMLNNHKDKGLKLIQSKPFRTSRHDRQARGRVGRQGEPGEIASYASLADLSSIGVNDDVLRSIDENFFVDGRVSGSLEIGEELIAMAQSNTESDEDRIIASQVGVGYAINCISTKFINTRSTIVRSEDLTFVLYNMIEDTINTILKENVPAHKRKRVSTNKKIPIKKLKIDSTIEKISQVFGIDFSEEALAECRTVNDLKNLAADKIERKISAAQEILGVKGFNEFVRERMKDGIDKTYDSFMYHAENIRYQEFNDKLAQNADKNRLSDINILHNQVVETGWYDIMGNIFNPERTIKDSNEMPTAEINPDVDTNEEMVSIDSFEELQKNRS